jgi:hypothetical protein
VNKELYFNSGQVVSNLSPKTRENNLRKNEEKYLWEVRDELKTPYQKQHQ